ncbi:non-homologous end joining protein Ku [Kitasatospora cathayae]|uniref:Non-homologous end joining protein Ku n=1 Tax=Kitasatospora cathayae TaxID=3004092 RepID=A0ABY7QGV1_9ACTN|nr:Ku protein [Kitasatospora sp. HUAS 3-15]WBP92025.1 Ku protein [Kitasatospora sp. HUAS 3-15]
MARPMWTGVLAFGLVTVPVALYTATQSHDIHFHQLQRGTCDRVRNKRVNERTGKEVEYADIVKGYEVTEGEYVIVEPDELDQISPGRSRTIDIAGFVDLADVDPIFFDRTYYLGPRGREYAKIYALLVEALEHAGKAGLAMFAMRGKEYLTAVRSEGGLLELHTMHFADEIRDPRGEVGDLPEKVKLSPQEVKTAEQLIGMLAIEWKPDEWHDTYEEQVRKLVEDKLAGRQIAVSAGPAPEATNVVDLMDVLRRSLEDARKGEPAGKAKKPSSRTAAARASRSPKPTGGKKSTSAKATPGKTAAKRASATGKQQLSQLTKAELYKRATDLDIPHRSTMTRDELQHALEHAGRSRRKAS